MLSWLLSVFCTFYLLRRVARAVRTAPQLRQAGGHNEEQPIDCAAGRDTEPLAEVQGSAWERSSVFEHIERGLKQTPDGPAVICLFQPDGHLGSLFCHGRDEASAVGPRTVVDEQHTAPSHPAGGHKPLTNGQLRQHNTGSPSVEPHIKEAETTNALPNSLQSTSPCASVSYAQLHHGALKLAAGLVAAGVQPKSTLVMLIPNGVEYTLLLWTCVLLRVTYVSLDPGMLDISGFTTLKRTLRLLKPQAVVAPDAASGKAVDVAVSELQLPQPVRVCLSDGSRNGWTTLSDVAADGDKFSRPTDREDLVAAARRDSPNRIHSIMFTSGTSGNPKACPMRAGAMSRALHSQSWLIDPLVGARALLQPHNSRGIAPAQALQTWRAGGAVVLTGQIFSAPDAVAAIARVGVTFLVLTPPMVHEMAAELAAHPVDVSSVRRVQVGGDAVTRNMLRRTAALFPTAQVCINHGMTEGPGSFVWPFLGIPVDYVPSFGEVCPIGTAAPGAAVRIWDWKKQCVVPRRQLGELHLQNDIIIRHYMAGRSDESFYHDNIGRRWFKTGDLAMIDSEGLVYILGRKKDMIQRAGVGIIPAAVENTIEVLTGSQTVVVPVPHAVLGAEPFAVIKAYNGKTEKEVAEHVRVALGKDYALGGQASLEQLRLAEFPVNATRKVNKDAVESAVLQFVNKRHQGGPASG
ncbi:hypothetical protein C8A05DRAFT_39125 [Staphylotrichum tortipilum]|uniref:AMP-dependent synthetase/ligase domain-containing protein n=1 Tax=Staphylotrichum tortipilum TaxID=2831512 RepID=A0AAN6MBD3_9PEZI|nr:hypothetical protein C8A05DRAFT_39125 [Staphylotrichum longicolle]